MNNALLLTCLENNTICDFYSNIKKYFFLDIIQFILWINILKKLY